MFTGMVLGYSFPFVSLNTIVKFHPSGYADLLLLPAAQCSMGHTQHT